jgi:hypothetical protein
MSKYDHWRDFLKLAQADTVKMTFAQLEALASLPAAAKENASWWANEDSSRRHIQCRSWQDAGYIAKVDLEDKTVTFIRKS